MMVDKKFFFIFIFIVLIAQVSAYTTTYTESSITNCDSKYCNTILYSGTQYLQEDKEWKSIDKIESLKDKGVFNVVFIEDDINYPLEVIDYNMTSITLDLKYWSFFNDEIDLRIWKRNNTKYIDYLDIQEKKKEDINTKDYKVYYDKVISDKIVFNIFDLGNKVEVYNIVPGDIIEFGPNSTTVTLQTPDTENLEDSWINEGNPDYVSYGGGVNAWTGQYASQARRPLTKFDISSLNGVNVSNANHTFNIEANNMDADESYNFDAHHVYQSYSWVEAGTGVVTWNNRPTTSGQMNLSADSTTAVPGAQTGIVVMPITNMMGKAAGNNDDNLTIYIIPNGGTGLDPNDQILISQKETGTAGNRPKIEVTYEAPSSSVTITYPINGTDYETEVNHLNWSIINYTTLDTCQYSLNGDANVTVTCIDYNISISPDDGTHNIIFTFNDTDGIRASDIVYFTQDATAPNITNLIEFPTDPATYSLGTVYHFNATVTDANTLDDVIFEFNGTNYTATNISANIFNVSIIDLQAGVYNYRWFANDTAGNINNTKTGSYTINKATSQTSLTFDVASPQTYGTAITPTCSVTAGDGPAVLKQDGVTITSGVAITLGADTYSFNCSYTENANYTGSQNVSSYTIDKAIPIGSLTSNLGWEIDRGEEVIIGLSEANIGDGDVTYIVHRDNVEKGTGETWTPAAGIYTYLLNTTGGANWTENSTMNAQALTVLPSNPNITTLVEYPSDPVNYSQTTVYQFNATILDANILDDIIFEFNGTNYTATNISANVFNVSFTNLTAGTYNYRWFANDTLGNMNNTETGTYTIDKATPTLTLTATTPITYGTITDFAGGGCPVQLSCSLDISNNVYAAGTKIGNYSTAGNINYTSAYANFTVTINKASLTGTITGVSVINYTNAANITANETNNNDSDVTYILYRNNATVSNPDNTVLGVGTYYYHYNSTGGENYTANISIDTFTLTIDKATAEVYAYIENLRANYIGNNLTAVNEYLNGSLNVGAGNINMYLNDSLIASGTSPLYNITDFPLGSYYFNVTYDGNDNYTSDEEHWSINITEWTLSNLTGIFNLNADTGTTAYDVSGNINNGTISGATWGSDDIDVTLTDAVDYFINKNTGLFVLLNDARDKTLLSITFTYYEYADDFLGEIIIKILPGLLIMLVLIMIFRLFTSRRDDGTEERIYEY